MSNSNDITEMRFPDIKIGGNGQSIVLNTAENLNALLELSGYEVRINKMNLEPELLHSGVCIGSPDIIRSKLISLSSVCGLPKAAIDDHLAAIAQANSYHPVVDWLDGYEWDKESRVDKVIACLRSKDDELTTIVLKRWLSGCMASLLIPNYKNKLVPVLAGLQSYRKTAFVERICSVLTDAFLEGAELNPDNKDSILSCIRSWIVELGELERTTAHSQGGLKAFITRSVDTVRPPYARADIKKPRQTNLIATVNGTSFLKDQTGNSRYAVIELIEQTDMDTLNELLGWEYKSTGEIKLVDENKLRQFWLEVRHLLEVEGYSWNLTSEEQAKVSEQTEMFVDKGDYYATLKDYLADFKDNERRWCTSTQVCSLVGIHASKSNMVGKALAMLTQEESIERKFSGGVNRYLFPL
ncbi:MULTISPECIES: VapE domain-containing protein [Vibrio]|uniref:VapE domain-containing protein n=1 Tax=Vibrio TaxID=662 RepID=UPI000375197A|nr:VapE domain-containing protein [Vibrio splendidus]OED84122.1 virulence protein [Vibrio splendidus ZF-90]PTP34717.1 virulence protein [Vibrio splendidus]